MERVCAIVLLLAYAAAMPVRAAAPAVALPPLARVTASDDSGATWRQNGELGGAVVTAAAEIRASMAAAGWRLDKRIALRRTPASSELMLWICGNQRILFMVWEIRAGLCGFAWGEER